MTSLQRRYDVPQPARSYAPGIGQAVADRTVNRKILRKFDVPRSVRFSIPRDDSRSLDDVIAGWAKSQGWVREGEDDYHVDSGDDLLVEGAVWVVGKLDTEAWEDVAFRVAEGSSTIEPREERRLGEFAAMHHHLRQASVLMSGRHLQHGDETQATRPQEVFTNCATAAMSSLLFQLLLNGAGVGRSYDDDMMVVNFDYLPTVLCTIDWGHPDVTSGEINGVLTEKAARHLYRGKKIHFHKVADSREGWAKATELLEWMAFERIHCDDVLILDFSDVRCRGTPIKGMQDRPASGPGPLMAAIANVARIKGAGMDAWAQANYADHYYAECVLVGGARRAARMSTKWWRDKTIFAFIGMKQGGHLWSSNNSVTVDKIFWRYAGMVQAWVDRTGRDPSQAFRWKRMMPMALHAWKVLQAVSRASYEDGTGEPGFINVDLLHQSREGLDAYETKAFAGSQRYTMDPQTLPLMRELVRRVSRKHYFQITNPCGEITLFLLGGYCLIGDVVPFHALRGTDAESDDEAEDAFRVATRALIRTNTMDCLYRTETNRTNRIGVGITGLHEWIWARFGLDWHDIVAVDPSGYSMQDANGGIMPRPHPKAMPMWLTLSRFARAVTDEARIYSDELGVAWPHTDRTIKPAGTTSKLFGLGEGAHLPSMREYLRWVQFRSDDPLIATYEARGYPVRRLQSYAGTTIVGFPTQPVICTLGMGDRLVTAAEATPEAQYRYLRLLETFWIRGVDEDLEPLFETGNQVSYTLKYDPKVVGFEAFKRTLIEGQSKIRCCAVMPQTDASELAYEYVPEEPVTKERYERIRQEIIDDTTTKEDIGFEHVDCSTGACPVDFKVAA